MTDYSQSKAAIAEWSSIGGKWRAALYKQTYGWRLAEYKNGQELGVSYYPYSAYSDDAAAVAYCDAFVHDAFDVTMQRVIT